MKFRITMKDPDGPYDCILEEARNIVLVTQEAMEELEKELTETEVEYLTDTHFTMMKSCADKFMNYSEYITIEFDTETSTATVVPKGE